MSNDSYISLGECLCGTDATWYRTGPAPTGENRKRTSVGNIGLDDIEENLCDGCYKGFTGSLDTVVAGWKRVDSLQRQARAGEDGQESRPPWDDGFGDSQGGSDDW